MRRLQATIGGVSLGVGLLLVLAIGGYRSLQLVAQVVTWVRSALHQLLDAGIGLVLFAAILLPVVWVIGRFNERIARLEFLHKWWHRRQLEEMILPLTWVALLFLLPIAVVIWLALTGRYPHH